MIKSLLEWIAYKILDKKMKTCWIHRSSLDTYTKWMSRDFPIFEDMHEFFKTPYGTVNNISGHREDMKSKHLK